MRNARSWMVSRWMGLSVGVLVGLPALTGCVRQDEYDTLQTSYRSTQQQLVACEEEADRIRASEQQALAELRRKEQELAGLRRNLSSVQGELTSIDDDYAALQSRLSNLQVGPLPVQVESALQDLAARYPDLVTFDARQGMLRLASDFTFDLGSAELKRDAEETAAALARILRSPDASDLEVKVVGHTDNVPIRRAATRERHPTNMHLSVHRAISVRDALVGGGIEPERVQVAGYGQFRPLVPNGPGGAAENRRVDIYLVPSTAGGGMIEMGGAAPATDGDMSDVDDRPRRSGVEPMK